MNNVNNYTQFILNKDDRLLFLEMAIKHPFFSKQKDIRLYIAKYFFYDRINVLEKMTEIGFKKYKEKIPIHKVEILVKQKLEKSYVEICKYPVFFTLLKKPWFWGFMLNDENVDFIDEMFDSIGYVYFNDDDLKYYYNFSELYDHVCFKINSKKKLGNLIIKLDKENSK